MKVAVCDDDKDSLKQIETILKDVFQQKRVPVSLHLFSDGEELLSYAADNDIDILFMDIYLSDDRLGTDVIYRLREMKKRFCLVYLTSSNEFASEAFSTGAAYYLLKPPTKKKILTALHKCPVFSLKRRIVLRVNNSVLTLAPDEIEYVEVVDKYCYVHTKSRRSREQAFRLYCPIYKIAEQLCSYREFLSPHRSYIVNMQHVKSLADDFFIMNDGTKIPLKTNNRKELRDTYVEWLFDNT